MSFTVRPWQVIFEQRWTGHQQRLHRVSDEYARRGQYAIGDIAGEAADFVIARGARLRDDVVAMAGAVEGTLEAAAAEAERSTLLFFHLGTVDLLGAIASVGVEVAPAAFDHARAILSAVETRRDDERVHYHWSRGLAAIALDWPAVYRGLIGQAGGRDGHPPLSFTPGQTFAGNIHGFVTHLAGAVEHGASPDQVKPAWDELVADYGRLTGAKTVSASCLFWASWIIHHRLGGQPVAELGEALHATLYQAAGVEP